MRSSFVYDDFSENYDRFVNWESRLSYELDFLVSQMSDINPIRDTRGSILDAACSTGHHAIALSKKGFNCSGADISKKMIKIAKNNAEQAQVIVNFANIGFGQFSESFGESNFDGIICLGNSLPHILDEQSLLIAVNDFYQALRPGGKLIIQNQNFDRILRDRTRWLPLETYKKGSNIWLFSRFYDFEPDGLLSFNIIMITNQKDGDFKQQVLSTRLWPLKKQELIKHLTQVGFKDITLYGDLQGSDYNINNSGNLVITAKRR